MGKDSGMRMDREAGADAISAIAVSIGTEHGVVFSKRVWDIGTDLGHEYAHRLELSTATNTVRLYFADLDLTTSGNKSRKERLVDRLHRAIAQLVARTPARTYTYQ